MDRSKPMTPGERLLGDIKADIRRPTMLFRKPSTMDDSSGGEGEASRMEENAGGGSGSSQNQMWILQARRGKSDIGCLRRTMRILHSCINCGTLTESSIEQIAHTGGTERCHPGLMLTDFFGWLFRKGWATIGLLSLLWFYALVFIFTLLVMWSARIDNDCLRIGGKTVTEIGNDSFFLDAFSLSWNTFSTVGYGNVYPALSTESDKDGDRHCAIINFVTALEAFVGVVYAGFTGAVIFAKVTRITQRADVRFSDPLTMTFGPGVVDARLVNNGKVESRDAMQKFRDVVKTTARPSPFPVLSFRLANEMHDVMGGEIISACLNAAVIIENDRKHQVSDDMTRQINRDRELRMRSSLFKTGSESELFSTHHRATVTERMSDRSSGWDNQTRKSKLSSFFTSAIMKMNEEEEMSDTKMPLPLINSKLELDEPEHPIFKRVWKLNHIIDADSPLLTAEAKTEITNNYGQWPHDWNNHQAVRRAVLFKQLVVSFTGLSNITGALVYVQKVYEFDDIAVGYQFVNMHYRGHRSTHVVDMDLLNDVVEQNGGGGEPLDCGDETSTL